MPEESPPAADVPKSVSQIIKLLSSQLDEALSLKQVGTQLFKEGSLQAAIDKYLQAIERCPSDEVSDRKQKAMLHCNVGLCLNKLYEADPDKEQMGHKKYAPWV